MRAQNSEKPLTIGKLATVKVKRNSTYTGKIVLQLPPGYHVNSNAPNDPYLIPLRLTWSPKGPLAAVEVRYPKPSLEKSSFSDKPLSVFTGSFEVTTDFKVPANAPAGLNMMSGKLQYQACTAKECFRRVIMDVNLPVEIL